MKYRILLVDDAPLLRATARRAALQAGAAPQHVREVADGEAALAAMQQEPVDIVLLDTDMPVMDGMRFVEEKAKHPALAHVKVALLTGHGTAPRFARAGDFGVTHYLHKPFESAELRALVAELFPADR